MYEKVPFVNGGPPGISAERLNHIQTQYEEVQIDIINQKGSLHGIATLDAGGNVPKEQLGNAAGMEIHGDEWHDVQYARQESLDKTDRNLIGMAVELETVKGALLDGVDSNIMIETFSR